MDHTPLLAGPVFPKVLDMAAANRSREPMGVAGGTTRSFCWSRDGRYLAYVRHDALAPWATPLTVLSVRATREGDRDPIYEREDALPDGLVPVHLSWW